MPRPALSLYRQLPIAYKHRCLLLSVLTSTENEIDSAMSQISAGFTGVIVSRSQLETISALQQSVFPKVVLLSKLDSDELDCTVAEAQMLGASAIMLDVGLGQTSSDQQLQRLGTIATQARTAKLATIMRPVFNQSLITKGKIIAQAFALQLSVDYKIDFLLVDRPKAVDELGGLVQIAAGGNVLLQYQSMPGDETKRLLAAGADGVVVNLIEIMDQKNPGQAAYGLGEAVFGPGSYKP